MPRTYRPRRKVQDGMCSACRRRPARTGQSKCSACHAEYMVGWRQRKKEYYQRLEEKHAV